MDIAKAIETIRPGAEWTLDLNDYTGLTWLDLVQAKPTKAELATGWAEYTAKRGALAIQDECAALINARADEKQRERLNAVSVRIMKRSFGRVIPTLEQAKLDMADDISAWVFAMEAECKAAISGDRAPVWPTFDPLNAGWADFIADPAATLA